MTEQTEHEIQQRIRLACAGPGCRTRLWRNNVGTGWAGADVEKVTYGNLKQLVRSLMPGGDAPLRPGDVIIRQARPLHTGLCPGSADLVGFAPITITPSMVGLRLAVFAGVEVKRPGGRPTPEQRQWLESVHAAGGIAGVATSVAEAKALLSPAAFCVEAEEG
jgi:hypothetical protein